MRSSEHSSLSSSSTANFNQAMSTECQVSIFFFCGWFDDSKRKEEKLMWLQQKTSTQESISITLFATNQPGPELGSVCELGFVNEFSSFNEKHAFYEKQEFNAEQ